MEDNWFSSLSFSISLIARSDVLEKREEKEKLFSSSFVSCVRGKVSPLLSLSFGSDLASTLLEVEVTSPMVSLPLLRVDHHWRHARLKALRSATDLLRRRHCFKK